MEIVWKIVKPILTILINLGIYLLLFVCGVFFIKLCETKGFKQTFGEFGAFFIPVIVFLIILILFY